MSKPVQNIRNIIILGGGSAGFLAALAFTKKLPDVSVTVVHTPDIPIIGVGEATTAWFPWFLHEYLGLDRQQFYDETRPIWKLGIQFIWGPATPGYFNYPFDTALTAPLNGYLKPLGYYCLGSTKNTSIYHYLMEQRKSPCFRARNGQVFIDEKFGYHLENTSFVNYLEQQAIQSGVVILHKTFSSAEQLENGFIKSLKFTDSTTLSGDLFIDCSGFQSVLLGKTLQESFHSFADSLFCDSAITGSWHRGSEDVMLPFTTAETMEAGWCWRIDLRDRVNRGYVYSSAFVSDADAGAEAQLKNPRLEMNQNIIRFRSGRYCRSWVNNVVAIGNASGFVEPLESTGLHMIGETLKLICDILQESECCPSAMRIQLANRVIAEKWDDIKHFLAVHFKFNQNISSAFWQHCWHRVELGEAQKLIEFFQENGPSTQGKLLLNPNSVFGLNGYLNLLIDQGVKVNHPVSIPFKVQSVLTQMQTQMASICEGALSLEAAFQAVQCHQAQWLVPQGNSVIR